VGGKGMRKWETLVNQYIFIVRQEKDWCFFAKQVTAVNNRILLMA
jgi:hypothetical protein